MTARKRAFAGFACLLVLGVLCSPAAAFTPTLAWSTFLGGTTTDKGRGVALDANGNTYVIGDSFAAWGSPIRASAGGGDAFVAKIGSDGDLLWNTFLGGAGLDGGQDIAVDAEGNVYVTGSSRQAWGAPIQGFAGGDDTFVAKFNTNGALLWSSFLGGTGYDSGFSIALGSDGSVYVGGVSDLTWGTPLRAFSGLTDSFVAKLGSNGALAWSTFLGGSGWDRCFGIAVDRDGNAFVVGQSNDTWGEPLFPYSWGNDAFVAKLASSGALAWCAFLGEGGEDGAYGVAIGAHGDVFVSGDSECTIGPGWGAPIHACSGYSDGFVAMLDTTGDLAWNTFLGGWSWDFVGDIALDAHGNIYAGGGSHEAWGDPLQAFVGGSSCLDDFCYDAFVAMLDRNGALAWSTFLGGDGDDGIGDIAVEAAGGIAGTGSSDFPWGSPITGFGGGSYDAFAVRLENVTNTPPVAGSQTVSTLGSTSLGITLTATDAEHDPLTYTVVTSPAHGTLTGIAPDLAYRPAAGFIGTDSFMFLAHDGWLDSNIATVTIEAAADVIPPSGSILINKGAASTKTNAVTLNLAATDAVGSGLESMRFRNRDTDPYGAWEPYQATRSWTLPSELGTRKVYVQFRDRAGNISDANPAAAGAQGYVDAILLKEGIAPTGNIRINNGAASTKTTEVTLNLTASDLGGSGLGTMRFRNRDTDPYTAWEPFKTAKAWTLLAGAGTRKVYVQFRDLAENVSDANPAAAGAQGYVDSISLNP